MSHEPTKIETAILQELPDEGVRALTEKLFQLEAREPQDDDPIPLFSGFLGEAERARLLESGISEETIESGRYRRGELLAAGFVFINRIGNGEKPIFSGRIPFPDSGQEGEELDLNGRTLLTREELDAVYAYQQMRPELYGLQGRDLDEVRRDMASFFCAAVSFPPFTSGIRELATSVNTRIHGYKSGMPLEDARELDGFLKRYEAEWERENEKRLHDAGVLSHTVLADARCGYLRDLCKDLVDAYAPDGQFKGFGVAPTVRGHAIGMKGGSRQTRTKAQPSPFLESGGSVVFSPDVEVDGWRLNWVTVHLAGANPRYPGLSEMGGTGDQQYMPTGTYVEKYFIDDPDKRTEAQELEAAMATPGRDKDSIADEVIARVRQAVAARKQQRRAWFTRLFVGRSPKS